jgi:hypothetical protein
VFDLNDVIFWLKERIDTRRSKGCPKRRRKLGQLFQSLQGEQNSKKEWSNTQGNRVTGKGET